MAVNPNEDTEFNDALRAHGILPPKPVVTPSPSPPASPTLADTLASGSPTLDELDLLNEAAADSDEERLIASYRRQRLNEIKRENKAARRFDEVYPIGRDDYTREVTEASKAAESDEEEKEEGDGWHGTGVICFLYQPSEPTSVRLADQLKIIARRYPRTKIVSIVGNKCIENYPDRHLPTLFLYRNGSLRRQFVAYGKDRERTVEELEILLIATNMIDPRKASKVDTEAAPRRSCDGTDLEYDDDQSATRRPARTTGTVNGSDAPKNIRTATAGRDSDDSDFDL